MSTLFPSFLRSGDEHSVSRDIRKVYSGFCAIVRDQRAPVGLSHAPNASMRFGATPQSHLSVGVLSVCSPDVFVFRTAGVVEVPARDPRVAASGSFARRARERCRYLVVTASPALTVNYGSTSKHFWRDRRTPRDFECMGGWFRFFLMDPSLT